MVDSFREELIVEGNAAKKRMAEIIKSANSDIGAIRGLEAGAVPVPSGHVRRVVLVHRHRRLHCQRAG